MALDYPASSAKVRAASALIDAGADLEIYTGVVALKERLQFSLAVDIGDVDLWKAIVRRNAELNATTCSGTMPLGFAAESDRVDLIDVLVEGGAHVSAWVAHDDEFPHEYGPMNPYPYRVLQPPAPRRSSPLGDGRGCGEPHLRER